MNERSAEKPAFLYIIGRKKYFEEIWKKLKKGVDICWKVSIINNCRCEKCELQTEYYEDQQRMFWKKNIDKRDQEWYNDFRWWQTRQAIKKKFEKIEKSAWQQNEDLVK